MRTTTAIAAASLLAAALSSQNLVPNGHFDQGSTNWTFVAANDPLGTYGFAAARVTGNGPSMALFGDFKTLSPVMYVQYRSNPFFLPPAPISISFNAMWEKQVTTTIPSNTVNRVELRIYDASNLTTALVTFQRYSPQQTGLLERASFAGTWTAPTATTYVAELYLRHSNLAGIPYITWVDDLVFGSPNTLVYGAGCAGSGAFTPVISTANAPLQGTSNFTVLLNDALGPTPVLCALGASDTTWSGIPLPFQLGAGCSILASINVSFGGIATGSGAGAGSASQILPVPNNAALAGVKLFTQWFVADPAVANPFTLATTAGLWFTIQ